MGYIANLSPHFNRRQTLSNSKIETVHPDSISHFEKWLNWWGQISTIDIWLDSSVKNKELTP